MTLRDDIKGLYERAFAQGAGWASDYERMAGTATNTTLAERVAGIGDDPRKIYQVVLAYAEACQAADLRLVQELEDLRARIQELNP